MPLDSNSRSILGCCAVAVVLLLVWFHGNGSGLDDALSRCPPLPAPVDSAGDCTTCHQEEASRNAALLVDGVRRVPLRIVTTAPRS